MIKSRAIKRPYIQERRAKHTRLRSGSLHLEGAAIIGRVILKLSLSGGVMWVYVAKI
jgi:hypothetical protein